MAKNTLANAGDAGLIPGLGRFHILWGQLSLSTTTTEPTCCKLPATGEQYPHSPQLEKACVQQQRPSAAKLMIKYKRK